MTKNTIASNLTDLIINKRKNVTLSDLSGILLYN